MKITKQSLKKFFYRFVSIEKSYTSETTHLTITNGKTTITVNGKTIDPKSKQGKEVAARVNKKMRIVEGGMDKVADALRDIAKGL